jgi:hypothetical protein
MCGQQVFPLIPNKACSTKLGADAGQQWQAALKSFVSLPGADVDALVAYVQTLKK